MGVNRNKSKGPVFSETEKFERDLKECMRCRFFFGNSTQCINSKCYKEVKKPDKEITNDICRDCPYKQENKKCFPCMKKLLGTIESEE